MVGWFPKGLLQLAKCPCGCGKELIPDIEWDLNLAVVFLRRIREWAMSDILLDSEQIVKFIDGGFEDMRSNNAKERMVTNV